MIDVIINETGGVTVAHDEKRLDGYVSLDIALADGKTVMSGPGGTVDIGRLMPEMVEFLRPGMAGRSIRVSGWGIARVGALDVRIH
jgi:hypothetical protein